MRVFDCQMLIQEERDRERIIKRLEIVDGDPKKPPYSVRSSNCGKLCWQAGRRLGAMILDSCTRLGRYTTAPSPDCHK